MLKKGLLAVCLSTALLATANLPVLARNYTCDVCGLGQVILQPPKVVGEYFDGYYPCSKKESEVDSVYIREMEQWEECNNCGASYLLREYSKSVVVCNH